MTLRDDLFALCNRCSFEMYAKACTWLALEIGGELRGIERVRAIEAVNSLVIIDD